MCLFIVLLIPVSVFSTSCHSSIDARNILVHVPLSIYEKMSLVMYIEKEILVTFNKFISSCNAYF